MALSRDDLTFDKGNIGYGTMASIPEPTKGTAGDLAAEAASAGIVNTDASAELAQQVPNIVVPVNQSSDSDSDTTNTDYVGYYGGDTQQSGPGRSFSDDDPLAGGKDYQAGIFDNFGGGKNLLIGSILNMIAPGSGIAFNYAMAKKAKAAQEQRIDDAIREVELGKADEAFGDTRIGTGTQDYDEYSDTPTGPVGAQFGDSTYADPGVDAEENQPEPTYTAPAAYQGSPAYSGSDSDSGGSMSSQDEMDDGGRGSRYAVGGIVRLRKNKQNSRIHDRRKRLAMGGIASLHG